MNLDHAALETADYALLLLQLRGQSSVFPLPESKRSKTRSGQPSSGSAYFMAGTLLLTLSLFSCVDSPRKAHAIFGQVFLAFS